MLGIQMMITQRPKAQIIRRAFTLAEVLITLGIIGVVAAITIPTLIQNSQKQETVTRLQKAYSTITQAYKNAEITMGSGANWGEPTTEGDIIASATWWNTYFLPYSNLSIIKTCTGSISIDSECWASDSIFLDGASFGLTAALLYIILKDGTTLYLNRTYNALIYVDINGLKKPNVVGKDIFFMTLWYKAGYLGFSGQGSSRTSLLGNCSRSSGPGRGSYCGAIIQIDGWQIKDDYPW